MFQITKNDIDTVNFDSFAYVFAELSEQRDHDQKREFFGKSGKEHYRLL